MKNYDSATRKIDKTRYEEAICKQCQGAFWKKRKDSTTKTSLPYGVRGKNSVTCSVKCSKAYLKRRQTK